MKSLSRFIGISKVMMKYRIDSMLLSAPALKKYRFISYITPWHYFPIKKLNRGERIRRTLEELGPIFIKFGQTLSTRRDLIPNDIGDELAKLQDSCPPFDSNDAKKIIADSLGRDIDVLFKRFDDEPLGSASIAQAHSAKTASGDEVVVKVVRPDIEKLIKRDISFLYSIAKIIDKHPDGKRLRSESAVAEFEQIILGELDMIKEANNAKKLRANFENSDLLYVPKVFDDFTCENILTTERIYGTPISDVETLKKKGTDLKKLSENGVTIFFTQVFKHNFFHADMHPGNIFVAEGEKYAGVDFGIMGTLTQNDLHYLAENFLAFFNRDYKKVALAHLESGWVPADTELREFEESIRKVCDPMFDKPLNEISFGQVLLNLFDEARKFNISIQPQLLLMQKTLLNIEGLGRQLYPSLNLWDTAKPYLEELMKEKYDVKEAMKSLYNQAPSIIQSLPELPSLTMGALKKINQMRDFQALNDAQTKKIIEQSKKDTRNIGAYIFSASFFIVSVLLFINNFHDLSIASIVLSLITLFFFRKY